MTKDDWSEMTSCYRASTSVSTIVNLLRPARIEALEQEMMASLSSAELVEDSAGGDQNVRRARRQQLRHRTWEGASVRLTIDRIMTCQRAEMRATKAKNARIARAGDHICPCMGVKSPSGGK
jgi:hypothetical protein